MTDWRKDWESLNTDTEGSKKFAETRRMKLVEGDNIIRIVAKEGIKQAADAWVHYFTAVNTDGGTRKTKAACLGLGNCPICDSGNKARHEFYFNVINRVEQKKANGKFQVHLLQCGISIAEQIKALAMDDEYGNPLKYNIKITRKGTGKRDTTYIVQAARKNTPLTEDENVVINSSTDEGGVYDLTVFLTKKTKAELYEMLGKKVDVQHEDVDNVVNTTTVEEKPEQLDDDFDLDKEFASVDVDGDEDDF